MEELQESTYIMKCPDCLSLMLLIHALGHEHYVSNMNNLEEVSETD